MSDQPTEPTVPFEPSGEMETVGPAPSPRRSRLAVLTVVAAVVAAVLGGGAYAAYSFLAGGGPQPADVLPASTVAMVSVDLDPSAGQKIAAIRSIRRFPALKKALGLQADDDLRQFVFDKVTSGQECDGLEFDRDVKPWLGKRAAFAGVDLGGDHPSPVVALQITDAEKAKAGFGAIVRCTHPEDFAFVVGDGYLIASDTAGHAQQVLAKGKEHALADDAAYRKWTDEAGDAGIMTFYVAKKAAAYADELLGGLSDGVTGGILGDDSGDHESGSFAQEDFGSSDRFGAAKDVLDGFQGLGGTVRFADGGMELSVAAGGLTKVSAAPPVGDDVGDLPGDTAVALGLGVSKDFAKNLVGQADDGSDELVKEAEAQTGLELPEDLQTLLGTAVTLSLGGKAPDSLDAVKGPEDLPVGVVIHGDTDKIRAIITKAEDHLGGSLSDFSVNVEAADGKVAIGPGNYPGDELLKKGDLGDVGRFREAVPDAERAQAILYVDFDSKWRDLLVDSVTQDEGSGSGRQLDENTKPLQSLGISSWTEGGVVHSLFKVTTD